MLISSIPFQSEWASAIGLLLSAVSLIGIGGAVSMLICHREGCWRRGRFTHGHYRLCHIHHPHVPSDGQIGEAEIKTETMRQLGSLRKS